MGNIVDFNAFKNQKQEQKDLESKRDRVIRDQESERLMLKEQETIVRIKTSLKRIDALFEALRDINRKHEKEKLQKGKLLYGEDI